MSPGENEDLRVTVVVPTFNRRSWIEQCLDSILAQTYSNIEIVVVDDRSSDDTVEWMKAQPKYNGVRLHVHEKNSGASVARNTAIAVAEGDLVVFIDSDDLLLPDHVAVAVRHFAKYPDLGLFCCDSRMIDADGAVILGGRSWHENLADLKQIEIRSGFRTISDVFAYSNCFPGFTLRRAVLVTLGGFDQSIFPADDYDLALRVAASDYKVFYLHEPLCLRREHDGQCSGIFNSVKTQVELINALRRAAGSVADKEAVKRRFAEINMELGIAKIKEGRTGSGLRDLSRSLASDPRQLRTLAQIAGRKLRGA